MPGLISPGRTPRRKGPWGARRATIGFFLPIIARGRPRAVPPVRVVGTRSPPGAGSPPPPGYYGDREAMAECSACPAGTVNAAAGAASFDACVACGKGFHNAFDGRALCLPCPTGTRG